MSAGAVSAACAVAGVLLAVVAGLIKYMLLPYLRDNVVTPIAQTQAQLAPTEDSEDQATVPDQLTGVMEALEQNTAETVAVARMFEGHLRSSDQVHNLLQAEVDRIWRHLRQQRR